MFSKAKEPPSVVSTRVLRTHRLNEVEAFRLHEKIRTIDNEIQSNYSQISDEIVGVRKNLVRIKKLKNNLNISVERRKLLRERGVFVIPSPGLEDEGVILRRSDGKKVVIRGKECYDGEIIRRCIDINFDFSKQLDSDNSIEEDDDGGNNKLNNETEQQENKKVLRYRIIVPPFHPGSRRNFKDIEEEHEEHPNLDLELPPSEDYRNKLRHPYFRVRAQTAVHTRKESKQGHQRPKSHVSLNNEYKNTHEKTRSDHEEADHAVNKTEPSVEKTSNDILSKEEHISQEKNKYLRPKTTEDAAKRTSQKHSSCSPHDTPTSSPRDNTKKEYPKNQNLKDERDRQYVKNSYTDFHHQNVREKLNSESPLPETGKLLKRSISIEDGIRIQVDKTSTDTTWESQSEIHPENFAQQMRIDGLENVSRRRPNDAVKIPGINASLQSNSGNHIPLLQPRKRSTVNINGLRTGHLIDDQSTTMWKRTESFNSIASATTHGTVRGNRKSIVSFAESERKHSICKNEFIYDARPDIALCKGYSTMQMTIGGKQVQLCVPKFTKDGVVERARAKSAAKIADDRTRGGSPTKSKLILNKI